MKNWQSFILGFISGVFVVFVVLGIIGKNSVDSNKPPEYVESEETTGQTGKSVYGATWFDEPGDIIDVKSFKVFQAIGDNAALAYGESYEYSFKTYSGTLYLLYNSDGKYYYDDEIVKVPKGKVPRQVGIYRYETKAEYEKTVPIVMIMDK